MKSSRDIGNFDNWAHDGVLANLRTQEHLDEALEKNFNVITKDFKDDINQIITMIDYQIELYGIRRNSEHCMSTYTSFTLCLDKIFHKNISALYGALILTNSGLYGPARVLFRMALEYLVIGKYLFVTQNKEELDLRGENEKIAISHNIRGKINRTVDNAIDKYYKFLHKFSHGNSSAIQEDFTPAYEAYWDEEDMVHNYDSIKVLLECNYYLVYSYMFKPNYPGLKAELKGLNKIVLTAARALITKMNKITKEYKKDLSYGYSDSVMDSYVGSSTNRIFRSFIYNYKKKDWLNNPIGPEKKRSKS